MGYYEAERWESEPHGWSEDGIPLFAYDVNALPEHPATYEVHLVDGMGVTLHYEAEPRYLTDNECRDLLAYMDHLYGTSDIAAIDLLGKVIVHLALSRGAEPIVYGHGQSEQQGNKGPS